LSGIAVDKLSLRYWDDPVLSKVCDKIEGSEFGPQLEEFSRQLIATMDASNGVGLAAPQVGVTKRLFVMRFPDHKGAPPIAVCNPVLILSGERLPGQEGCLSLPNIFDQVYRAGHVNMTYTTPSGEAVELLLDMWDARVAQHEFDHLNGIMFFDYKDQRPTYGARMSKQVSKNVLRKWEKSHGNYRP
jgi:peptide deformylase